MTTVLQCPPAYEDTSVTIPDGIKIIAPNAFRDCINIKKVIMPDSVIHISYWAFCHADNLSEINISENCEEIMQYAFQDTSLKAISIPAATTLIGNSAFGPNCFLEEITVDENNSVYYFENGMLRSDISVIKYLSGRNESSLTIPEGITEIGYYAFDKATNLTTIKLPDSLIYIAPYAFKECQNLEHIEIPENVEQIDDCAFVNCYSLVSIIIPENVEEIVTSGDVHILYGNNNCTIYAVKNSVAHQYATKYNINYKSIDDFICTNGHQLQETYETIDSLNTLVTKTCTVCGDKGASKLIQKTPIYDTSIELEFTSAQYTGQEIEPKIKQIKYGDQILVENVDYVIDFYLNNVDVGTGLVYISGKSNFVDQTFVEFEITPFDISTLTPVLEYTSIMYDGTEKCPYVSIDGLSCGSDYDFSYSNNINIGTATVTIYGIGNYVGSFEKTFTIIPNLSAPTTLKLTLSDGHNDVKVSWSKVSNADGYVIYYKKSTASSYTKLKTIYSASTLTYTVKDLTDATKYYFKVYPLQKDSTGTYIRGTNYKTASIYTLRNLSAPKTVTLSLYGYDDVKVSWSKVSNANGYYVYYKKSTSSSYTYAGKTTTTSFKKANLSDGVKYYFKIVPYYVVNSKTYKDDSYKTASIYTLKKLTVPSVSKYSSSKVKLSWSNINGESGYQISMSTSKTGTNIVSTYSTTTGKTKIITTKKGKTYYYKIRAYKVVDGKKIYAPWSNVKAYKLK